VRLSEPRAEDNAQVGQRFSAQIRIGIGQCRERQQQIILIGNWCSIMVSQENQRFIISAVVGLIVLLGLITYTNLPTLVRLPAALIVSFVVQRILESFGQ